MDKLKFIQWLFFSFPFPFLLFLSFMTVLTNYLNVRQQFPARAVFGVLRGRKGKKKEKRSQKKQHITARNAVRRRAPGAGKPNRLTDLISHPSVPLFAVSRSATAASVFRGHLDGGQAALVRGAGRKAL